jgi:hypothetical protein
VAGRETKGGDNDACAHKFPPVLTAIPMESLNRTCSWCPGQPLEPVTPGGAMGTCMYAVRLKSARQALHRAGCVRGKFRACPSESCPPVPDYQLERLPNITGACQGIVALRPPRQAGCRFVCRKIMFCLERVCVLVTESRYSVQQAGGFPVIWGCSPRHQA